MQSKQLTTYGVIDPKANILLVVEKSHSPLAIVKAFEERTHGDAFVNSHRYSEVGEGALEMDNLALFCVYDLDKSDLDSSALTEDEGGLATVDDPAGDVRAHAKLCAVILREAK